MVAISERLATWAPPLLWAEAGVQKLPPPTRAAVMMALIGIALAGMLIVAIILLGGHWVRRQGLHRRGRAVPPDRVPLRRESQPPSKPAAEALPNPAPPTPDTVSDQSTSGET